MEEYGRSERFQINDQHPTKTKEIISSGLENFSQDIKCPKCGKSWHVYNESPMYSYQLINGEDIANHFYFKGITDAWVGPKSKLNFDSVTKESEMFIYQCTCGTPLLVHIMSCGIDGKHFNYEIYAEQLEWMFENNK